MNDRHLPPSGLAGRPGDPDDHARSWALIPWLVNGRAAGEERRRALAHLQQCAACRAEWQAQEALAQALRASQPQVQGLPDADAGLQRLMGRLDPAPAAQAPRRPVRGVVGRVVGLWGASVGGRVPLALAAAVVVQAVGLVVLGLHRAQPAPGDYAALSETVGPAGAAATLRLLPDGSMPLAQWQALLQAHGLVVVDGPNSAGAYGVALRAPGAGAASAELVARLRATPGVLMAEPVGRP